MKPRWGLPLVALTILGGAAAYAQSAGEAVRETDTTLTDTEVVSRETQAGRWGLTVEEYRRYEEAIAGPRGRLGAPNISPIEVLGIEARTTAERDRYADMWVEMLRDDTARSLAFTRAVHDAWKRHLPGKPLIDRAYINKARLESGSRWGAIPLPGDHGSGAADHLLVFTEIGCASCDTDVRRLVEAVQGGTYSGIDLYIMDVEDGDVRAVQAWAMKMEIPPSLVQGGTLTLNFDGGTFQRLVNRLQFTPAGMPVVMRREGQDYDLVSLP